MKTRKKVRPLPEVDFLRQYLNYNPDTGAITQIGKRNSRRKIGEEVGYKTKLGYVRMSVKGLAYMVHRIAWAMHYGYDPGELQIDHINGVRTDNRIENLRLVTNADNHLNMKKPKSNSSGVKGVSWCKLTKRWFAYASRGGVRTDLGRHDSFEHAATLVRAFREEDHGEFARHE